MANTVSCKIDRWLWRVPLKGQLRFNCLCSFLIMVAVIFVGCKRRPHATPYVPSKEETELDRYNRAGKEGRYELAEEGLGTMCRNEQPVPRACYDLTRLLFKTGCVEEARKETIQFVKGFPEHGLSPVAVKRLARSYIENDEQDKGVAVLETIAQDVSGSDVHDSVLFQISVILKASGLLSDEARMLMRIVDAHSRWESQVWDDAIWRVIEIREQEGNEKDEQHLLERLLDTRESSWFIGSYNSPYHDDALLKLGYLHFKKSQNKKAMKLFEELAALETSRLQDDALMAAAEVHHTEGRENKACRLLQRIIDEMPAATARDKAIEMTTTIKCH